MFKFSQEREILKFIVLYAKLQKKKRKKKAKLMQCFNEQALYGVFPLSEILK